MISPGCTNCYAMRMAARLQAMNHPHYRNVTRKSGGRSVWTGSTHTNARALSAPLKWKRRKKIFVNSMSDLFQEDIPDDFIVQVWSVMREAHWHIFQVLTKRPENMAHVFRERSLPVLGNVWLGTSVELAEYASRIDELRKSPAVVRFVSFEPLLAPLGELDLTGIQWAIVGGESGPGARPIRDDWIESVRKQCRRQGVAFFFKQWGGTNKKATGRHYLGRTWDEFPEAISAAS